MDFFEDLKCTLPLSVAFLVCNLANREITK